MTATTTTVGGELNVGQILGASLAVSAQNWKTFAVLAIPLFAAHLLFVLGILPWLVFSLHPQGWLQGFALGYVGAFLLALAPNAFLQAGVAYAAIATIDGRASSLGDCAAVGARSLAPLLVALLLVQIATMAGLVVLVVPGVILSLALGLAAPVVVLEQVDPLAGLKRSIALTRGHRGKILLLSLLLAVFGFMLGLGVGLPVRLAEGLVGASLDASAAAQVKAWGTSVTQAVVQIAALAVNGAAMTTVYALLRYGKGSASVEGLASVFD